MSNTNRVFTDADRIYICGKIPQIPWPHISYTLRMFWVEWRERNE